MKRTLVVLAAAVLAAALLLPGLVGGLALRQHERHIGMTTLASPNFTISTESFERGWFRSRSRYRIELGGPLREVLRRRAPEATPAGELPALIVDTVLHHGPFALGAVLAEGGSLMPVLGIAISKLSVVANGNEPFALPGDVVTRIGFGGGGTARYASGPLRLEEPGESLNWEGATIEVDFDAGGTHAESSGSVGALTIVGANGRFLSGSLEFTAVQTRADHGLWLGESRIDWTRLVYTGRGREPAGLHGLHVASAMRPADGSVTAALDLSIAGVGGNGWSAGPLVVRTQTTRLDPEALGRVLESAQSMNTVAPLDAAAQAAFADDLAALLAGGPRFALDELRLQTPEGELFASATVEFAESATADARDLVVLAFAARSEISLQVPTTLVAAASAANPAAQQYIELLLDTGLLRVDDDGRYAVHAVYDGGLLTVNGIPVPMPVPAT